MSRLIDADALMVSLKIPNTDCEECKSAEPNYGICMRDFAESCTAIKNAPTIEERKRGKWIELTNTNHTYVCSVCGRMLVNITDGKNMVTKNYPFCHCGADMRERQEESHCDDCRFYDEECVYCPVKQERREE